jgi:hypothetical protein
VSHYHSDCVECLQAKVEALEASLRAQKIENDYTDKLRTTAEETNRRVKNELADLKEKYAKALCEIDAEQDAKRANPAQYCSHCGYSQKQHSKSGTCPTYQTTLSFNA